jgi:hypothetical protein
LAAGLAAWSSGLILGQTATGEITHFQTTSLLSVFCALSCIYFSRFLGHRHSDIQNSNIEHSEKFQIPNEK